MRTVILMEVPFLLNYSRAVLMWHTGKLPDDGKFYCPAETVVASGRMPL